MKWWSEYAQQSFPVPTFAEDEQAVFDKWILNCLADVGVAIDIRGEYPAKRPLPRELVELVE